jgi:signal recognition particle receptor subunit beta
LYVCLYESSPSTRFDISWQALEQGLLGIVMLMDSSAPETFKEVPRVVETIAEGDVPFVIAANKQDLQGAVSTNDLRLLLNLGDIPIVPCVATKRSAVKNVLLTLLNRLDKEGAEEPV